MRDGNGRYEGDGSEEYLPTVSTLRPASLDPEEDARLAAEHLEKNRHVTRMLEKRGFGIDGDEPGGVQINRHLALGEEEG